MPPNKRSSLGFTANRALVPQKNPAAIRVDGVQIFSATHYYEGDNRDIARQMKIGDKSALDCAARTMIPLIPRGSVLVPIPGHEGTAKQTLQLCKAISSFTGLQVADVLRGNSRESNYVAKHEGKGLTERDMGFRKVSPLPEGKTPVYVDNVVDTATTAKAAYHAVGSGIVVTFAISDTLFQQREQSQGMHR